MRHARPALRAFDPETFHWKVSKTDLTLPHGRAFVGSMWARVTLMLWSATEGANVMALPQVGHGATPGRAGR
jgi:hypothetical protein